MPSLTISEIYSHKLHFSSHFILINCPVTLCAFFSPHFHLSDQGMASHVTVPAGSFPTVFESTQMVSWERVIEYWERVKN